ncbi:DnaJ domain-containing protein [Thermodesulfobacteriota bacterium]
MKFVTVLLIMLALIYIISPYDFLPDFFPITGWFDDAFLLGILIYYLKYRKLPGFLSRLMRSFSGQNRYRRSDASGRFGQDDDGPELKSRSPYEVLGLKPGADPEEIQTAYRNAAQAYHPDKVSHLGPELRELAQKKFIEIQKAHDILMGKNT